MDWDTERSRWRNEDVLAPEEEMRYGKDGGFRSEGSLDAQDVSTRMQASTPRIMGGLQALWRERMGDTESQRAPTESFEDGKAAEGPKPV